MRFGKFVVIGMTNTLITLAAFNVLAIVLGVRAPLANAFAYSIGIANSYFWNSRWTFGDRALRSAADTKLRFVAVNLVGLALTTTAVWLLAPRSPAPLLGVDIPEVVWLNLAEATAIVAGLIWNYSISSRWVFVDRPEQLGEYARTTDISDTEP